MHHCTSVMSIILFVFIFINFMMAGSAHSAATQSRPHGRARGTRGKSTKKIDFEGKLTYGKIQDYPIESELKWDDTYLGKAGVKQCKKTIKRTNTWLVVCGRCPSEQTFGNRMRYNQWNTKHHAKV
eukprot:1084979_1